MVPTLILAVIGLLVIPGAIISFRMEAFEIHRRNTLPGHKELPHTLLTLIRFIVACMVLLALLPPPFSLAKWVMCLIFQATLFGPIHRLGLNLTRKNRYPQESKTITWHHLRKRGYDRLLWFIPNEPVRFLTLCSLEVLIAVAMFGQIATNEPLP